MTTDHLARRRWKWKRKEAGHENPVDDDANYISKNLFVKDRQGQNGICKDRIAIRAFAFVAVSSCPRDCPALPCHLSGWGWIYVWESSLNSSCDFQGKLYKMQTTKRRRNRSEFQHRQIQIPGSLLLHWHCRGYWRKTGDFSFAKGVFFLASFLVLVRWQMWGWSWSGWCAG